MLPVAALDSPRQPSPKEAAPLTPEKNIKPTRPASNDAEVTPSQVHAAVKALNKNIQTIQTSLLFKVDEESGKTVINVLDKESGEVIRSIPPEVMLKIAAKLQEVLDDMTGDNSGVIVDVAA